MDRPSATAIPVTIACFLTYFAMSGMLAPIGLISKPLSQVLGQSVPEVTQQFSWLTFGILVGAGLALVIVNVMELKRLIVAIYALSTAALVSLALHSQALGFWLALFVVGTCFGIGLAAAATSIARLYTDARRASMLVITDSCFSIAGFVTAGLAVRFVAAEMHWASAYLVIAGVCGLIVLISLSSRFPEAPSDHASQTGVSGAWPAGVWLCIAALFVYTLGQNAMLWWLPNYLSEVHGAPAAEAGAVVGQFWTGMFLTQLFVAWFVFKTGVSRLVMVGAVTTLVGSVPLWLVDDAGVSAWLAFGWGVANLGMLKMTLSFGTQLARVPSGAVVSALLFGSTSGTAVSPFVTGEIAQLGGYLAVLQFSSLCYAVLLALIVLAHSSYRPAVA